MDIKNDYCIVMTNGELQFGPTTKALAPPPGHRGTFDPVVVQWFDTLEEARAAWKKLNGVESRATVKVQCVETGQVFKSISEATAWLPGVSNPAAISNALDGRRTKTAGGYHWRSVS